MLRSGQNVCQARRCLCRLSFVSFFLHFFPVVEFMLNLVRATKVPATAAATTFYANDGKKIKTAEGKRVLTHAQKIKIAPWMKIPKYVDEVLKSHLCWLGPNVSCFYDLSQAVYLSFKSLHNSTN